MINTSDYKRTGIFIEERVTPITTINAPSAPNVHFVPGFSKKSTVFNRPVLITSNTARKTYFGDIDRTLEKKGSFFHRTIDIALQTAPVYAMNLLKTNANDTLDYASISLAAQFDNDVVQDEQYDKFFNKTGFWLRDTESFLFFANDPFKKIHFTNVSDKRITFFMFKATNPALEITAENWYANKGDDMPLWISPKALMSDYLVRVVAVVGDYTNYAQLSVDNIYGKYFSSSGLRKNQVDAFVRERGVTVLGDYTGSVIPYFEDMNGTRMFIESLINNESDRTGLFCAMDIDSIDTDYSTGVIDLIGETLVGIDKSRINFMSYVDTIEEIDTYDEVDTDVAFEKSITSGFSISFSNSTNAAVGATNLTYNASSPLAFFNGEYISVTSNISTYSAQPLIPMGPSETKFRRDVFYISPNGVFEVINGVESPSAIVPNALYPNGAYVVAYADIEFTSDLSSVVTKDVTFTGVNGLAIATYIGYTVSPIAESTAVTGDLITYNDALPTGQTEIIFKITSTNKTDYASYFANLLFTELTNNLSIDTSYILYGSTKEYLNNSIITIDNDYLTNNGKIVNITFDNTSLVSNTDIFYTDRNAQNIYSPSILGFTSDSTTPNYALIGTQSEMYVDFINGMINSGDYFYESFGELTLEIKNITSGINTGGYLIMETSEVVSSGIDVNQNIIILALSQEQEISLNALFTYDATPGSVSDQLGLTVSQVAFKTETQVQDRIFMTPTEILLADAKVYLKMYSVGKNIFIDFCGDNTLTTPYGPLNIQSGLAPIHIYSGESNYTQTLEIVTHSGYTMTDTKFLIDMTRYNEVKINDYVKAYYDINDLQGPDEQPKKFARIIKKTAWSGNTIYGTQYAEITVDVKYDITNLGGGLLQTTRYTSIDNYIDTYKGITLKGFQVQQTSIPDGTETRQKDILSILVKDSPLYCAITNKQKFNFRYLIDSFGLGLTEFSKQEFADLVGKRKNAIAFLNAPSAKMFRQSTNPSFINVDGTLNMEYVRRGGNEEQNPSFLYSFAQGSGKDDGRDCSGYFFPYVTVNDNGRPLSFPPAAYVANTYMRKNSSTVAGKYNFTVAAGVNDGLILGVANTEMDFTEKDYESADAMGLNLLSYNSNYGYYIETEYTASQTPKSALSNLHVRELLIDMENEMYAMLFKYQYQFNIPSVRAKIKREADDICQKYFDRGGITYYQNIIDETNNTADLIDNQFGLLETTIVPVSAMAKIVNIFNITTNGALAGATGFQ